ncbi:MAG: NUDIX domain-containing protein [Candidatus Daviesbacteria bacterium]|nr:NUDIX domain-containing protein [Candidatus Daviesbacteria bacterium]
MKTIKKVALAVFKDKKMLQVRSKNQPLVFFTLGGKLKEGESEIEALKREVMEEVGCEIEESSLKYLTEFEDVAHGGGRVAIRVFEGKLIGIPKPSSEIAEIGWFDSNSDKKNISVIAKRTIFPWLKKHGYIT